MAFKNARGVDVRIARIFNTFGPRMREHDDRASRNTSLKRSPATPSP